MDNKLSAVLDSGMRLYSYSFLYVSEFKWLLSDFTGNNANSFTSNGKILLSKLPRNIYKISVRKTRIPKSSNPLAYYQKMVCHLLELPNKTYMSNTSNTTQTPFHFEFLTEVNGNYVELIPEKDNIEFNPPLKSIDVLTASFYDPFNKYYFDNDSGYYTVTFGTFTTFTLQNAVTTPLDIGQTGSNTILDGKSQIFPLNTGSIVIIVTTITSNSNASNSLLNRPEGFIATKHSSTSFTIPINTAAYAPYVQTDVLIYYQNFRFSMVLDLYYKN